MHKPYRKIINKRDEYLSQFIKKHKYLILIVLIEIIFRVIVFFVTYSSINLFCGDSGCYIFLAHHLEAAMADRPSGYPFFLSLFIDLPHAKYLLLLVNNLLGIATVVLFFDTIKRYFKSEIVPFLLSLLVVLNLGYIYTDSLVFMSDTLALFFLVISINFALKEKLHLKFVIFSAMFLGWLVIVKSVFLYLAPFILAIPIFKIIKNKDGQPLYKFLSVGFILLIFSAIPLYYSESFVKKRLGVQGIEFFSGRSAISNVIPNANCQTLVSLVNKKGSKENLSLNECEESKKLNTQPVYLLWGSDSIMAKIEKRVNPSGDRVSGNRYFKGLLISILFHDPLSGVRSMFKSLSYHVANPISVQMSFNQPTSIDRSCEGITSFINGKTGAEYVNGWHDNYLKNKYLLNSLAFIESYGIILINNVVLGAFVLLPLYSLFRYGFLSNLYSLYFYFISLMYLGLISLGSGYDLRYYLVFNVLALVSISIFARHNKKNRKKQKGS